MAKHKGTGFADSISARPKQSIWTCVQEGHWHSRAKTSNLPCVKILQAGRSCWVVFYLTPKSIAQASKTGASPYVRLDPRTDISPMAVGFDELIITQEGAYFKRLSVAKAVMERKLGL